MINYLDDRLKKKKNDCIKWNIRVLVHVRLSNNY